MKIRVFLNDNKVKTFANKRVCLMRDNKDKKKISELTMQVFFKRFALSYII